MNLEKKTLGCVRNHKTHCGSCETYLLTTYQLPVMVRTDKINRFSTTTLHIYIFKRNSKSYNFSQEHENKVNKFKKHAKIFLGFSPSKCYSFDNCSYPKIEKVSIPEQSFLTVQRTA